MEHGEFRLFWPFRALFKLTLGFLELSLHYIVPYSPYKTTVGTLVSQIFLFQYMFNPHIVDLFLYFF